MQFHRILAGFCIGLILTGAAFSAPEISRFPHQVKMVAFTEEFQEGKLFLDPELAMGNWFGGGITVGDWNRDGVNDIFISSFLADPDGVANAGAIHVFLGPEFEKSERITALPNPEEGDNFGMQIDFLDMNGDNIPDLVTTGLRSRYYPEDGSAMLDQAGSFRVVWGPEYKEGIRFFDEAPEAKATLGRGLGAGDFNGDGKPDLAIGAPGAYGGQGKVIFRYGPDFKTQQELLSPAAANGERFAVGLTAGDWDRDGHVDLLAGVDYAASSSGLAGAGHLEIWYGPDFQAEKVKIFEDPNPVENYHFGTSVDMGDLTGDGIPDVVVGVSNTQWEGKSWVGQVLIFPGPTYQEKIAVNSPTPDENAIFGSEVKIADINQDGTNDLIVGEYYATVNGLSMAGRAWLFLGIKTGVTDWGLY